MSVNIYCFENETPNAVFIAEGNAQFLIAHCVFLFLKANIGWQMYSTNTLSNQTHARREIYFVYIQIKGYVPALIII